MSNLKEYALEELERAGLFDKKSDYEGELGKAVYELIEKFADQDHSGASANLTVKIFSKLALFEPLTPLTGDDDEWLEVDGKELLQNKRDSRIFKDKDGKVTFLDAIVWQTEEGVRWSGKASGVPSKLEFKEFPAQPISYIIDVLEEEVKPDQWVFKAKNPKDLEAVWKTYKDPRDGAE